MWWWKLETSRYSSCFCGNKSEYHDFFSSFWEEQHSLPERNILKAFDFWTLRFMIPSRLHEISREISRPTKALCEMRSTDGQMLWTYMSGKRKELQAIHFLCTIHYLFPFSSCLKIFTLLTVSLVVYFHKGGRSGKTSLEVSWILFKFHLSGAVSMKRGQVITRGQSGKIRDYCIMQTSPNPLTEEFITDF